MNVHWEQIIAMIMRLVQIHLVPTPVNVTKVSTEMEKIVKVGKNLLPTTCNTALTVKVSARESFRTSIRSMPCFFLVYLSN